MVNKKGLEKYLYRKIVERQESITTDDREHVLTEEESNRLKKIQSRAMFRAALAGTLGILLLYVPYHLWQRTLFPTTNVWFPLYNDYIEVGIIFLLYSLVLVVIEIAYLTYNNIQSVKDIAHACNYPMPEDPFFEINMDSLIAVGLEKKIKSQSQIGINPFAGLSRAQVFLFTAFNLAKAAMTNFLFKLLVKRVFGRYAIRLLVDLAGIPVYAFWNAFAARYVVREARVRIMANPIIRDFANEIYEEQKDNPEFITELYYMLDLVAITKRKFHGNHYLLALITLDKFGIQPDPKHQYDADFLDRIEKSCPLTIQGFSKVNLLGMALDGTISKKEELLIYKWRKKGIYNFTLEETKNACDEFFSGKGNISLV
jgi:hypothetical protein